MMMKVGIILVLACVSLFFVSHVECGTVSVFGDSLAAPFEDWSWATNFNRAYKTNVHGGSVAISYAPSTYDALYYHATDFISTANFVAIEFWVYRPANGTTNVNFKISEDTSGGSTTVQVVSLLSALGGKWADSVWVKVSVSLSQFTAGVYDGFMIQDGSGTSNPAFIIDDIVLVTGSTAPSTSAPTTTAPTTTPTTTRPVTVTSTTPRPSTAAPSTAAPTTAKPTGVSTGDSDPAITALYTTTSVGQATYYGNYAGGGACMLDPTPQAGTVSAIAHTVAVGAYLGSKTCGMCLQVTGNGKGSGDPAWKVNGTRTVFVNNQCPECASGSLDFAQNGDGRWDITWKAVPCPITSKVQYVFKSGSSAFWVGIQVRNHVHPVYKFAIKVNGSWMYLPRLDYNYFVSSFSGLTFPIQIQLTSVKGEVLTDTIQSLQNGAIIAGNVQFTA